MHHSQNVLLRAPAKFIIFNTRFLVFDTKSLVFDTKLLVFNTKIIIFKPKAVHSRRDQQARAAYTCNQSEIYQAPACIYKADSRQRRIDLIPAGLRPVCSQSRDIRPTSRTAVIATPCVCSSNSSFEANRWM